jgi:hypothetical protein
MRGELRARLNQAAKAADLLRSAAERIDTQDPEETPAECAARLRGVAVLALTGALEIGAASGFADCLVAVELHTVEGAQ